MAASHKDDGEAVNSALFHQLINGEAETLLHTIDNLHELRIGDCLHLPPIIVLGAPSSGKSSVLEAIINVPFPTSGDAPCTRFATEIIIRRAPTLTFDVGIKFAKIDKDQPQVKPFQISAQTLPDLPEFIKQAKVHMGMTTDGAPELSYSILRVTISGPNLGPLTLVDLPSLQTGSAANESTTGTHCIDRLIDYYTSKSECIILAVIAADCDPDQQAVLGEAKKYDPNRERTLGIITKPDLAEPSYQRLFADFVQQDSHMLKLGWHVLRNRGDDEIQRGLTSSARDAQEEGFLDRTSIPFASRGVGKLRESLSKAILQNIQKTMPGYIRETEASLKSRNDELARLGKPRSTPEELRSYLLDIGRQFERLASDAVDGRYSDPFFGSVYDRERKLRALLRNLNFAFDVTISTKGMCNKFDWHSVQHHWQIQATADDPSHVIPESLLPFLEEYDFPEPVAKSKADLNDELIEWAVANQGKELSINDGLVIELFKIQSKPWKEIASSHIEKVLEVTKAVVEQIILHVVGVGADTAQSLFRDYVDPFFDSKRDVLQAKLEELLLPYVSGYGPPLDKDFRSTVSATAHASELQNSKLGTEKVIDNMMAYYGTALRIFTDNVINLAIENCLVRDIPNKILTIAQMSKLSKDRLKELASESEDVQARRELLGKRKRILSEGLQQCKRHKPRELTVLPSNFSKGFSAAAARRSVSIPVSSPQSIIQQTTTHSVASTTPQSTAVNTTTNQSSQRAYITAGQVVEPVQQPCNTPDPSVPKLSGQLSEFSFAPVSQGTTGGLSGNTYNPFGPALGSASGGIFGGSGGGRGTGPFTLPASSAPSFVFGQSAPKQDTRSHGTSERQARQGTNQPKRE